MTLDVYRAGRLGGCWWGCDCCQDLAACWRAPALASAGGSVHRNMPKAFWQFNCSFFLFVWKTVLCFLYTVERVSFAVGLKLGEYSTNQPLSRVLWKVAVRSPASPGGHWLRLCSKTQRAGAALGLTLSSVSQASSSFCDFPIVMWHLSPCCPFQPSFCQVWLGTGATWWGLGDLCKRCSSNTFLDG